MLSAAEWLAKEDSQCFGDRCSRLEWLDKQCPSAEYWTFPGGVLAKHLFEEMRYCFVYAQFLGVNLLGLAYIERTLAAIFYGAGRDDLERAGLARLLREAQNCGLINCGELHGLEKVRKRRNIYVHFRKPLHKESVEYRSIVGGMTDYDVIESDAAAVVAAAFHIVDKNAIY